MLLFLLGTAHKSDKFQVIPAATKNEIPSQFSTASRVDIHH